MAQSSQGPASPNSSPIVIEQTGVAIAYEATKNIPCGNLEWQVSWKSDDQGQLSGSVTIVIAGKSKALPEVQAELFDKFKAIDAVSATCNQGADGTSIRSSLLVLGNDQANRKALAQLRFDPDAQDSWSFRTIE